MMQDRVRRPNDRKEDFLRTFNSVYPLWRGRLTRHSRSPETVARIDLDHQYVSLRLRLGTGFSAHFLRETRETDPWACHSPLPSSTLPKALNILYCVQGIATAQKGGCYHGSHYVVESDLNEVFWVFQIASHSNKLMKLTQIHAWTRLSNQNGLLLRHPLVSNLSIAHTSGLFVFNRVS